MTISVIIPVYNAEKTLEACVASVLKQSLPPEEILLVDDGSLDGSGAVEAALQAQDPRVRMIPLPHGGVSAARNRGLKEARGELVLFLDADDELTEGALEALVAGLDEETDAVCGAVLKGNEAADGSAGETAALHFGRRELLDRALADPTMLLTIHGWLFRRDLCAEETFHPGLRLGEDSEWMLRVLGRCRQTAFISAPVYRYRLTPGSVIHRWEPGKTEAYLKMLKVAGRTAAAKEKNWPVFVLTVLLLMLTHDTFHPDNPAERKAQLREARRLRELPVMREAFREADFSELGAAKRFALWCLKRKLYRTVRAIVRIRQGMNARR